jgi:hypothetical protein
MNKSRLEWRNWAFVSAAEGKSAHSWAVEVRKRAVWSDLAVLVAVVLAWILRHTLVNSSGRRQEQWNPASSALG